MAGEPARSQAPAGADNTEAGASGPGSVAAGRDILGPVVTGSGNRVLVVGGLVAAAVAAVVIAVLMIGQQVWQQQRLDALVAAAKAENAAQMAQLRQQVGDKDQVIRSQNAAIDALAAKAGSPGASPDIRQALEQLARGDRSGAEAVFAEVLARKQAEGAAADHEAAEAARHLGALAYFTDTKKALAAYRQAARLDPGDTWTWIYIARLAQQAGQLAVAESAAIHARDTAATAGDERDVSVADNTLGDVRVAQGDLAGALQAYGQDLAITQKLAGSDPGNAGWQRDLSVSWNKLGDVRRAQGDLAGALQAYEETHTILSKLAGSDPGNAEWQRDLIVSHVNLAEAGSAPAQHYREALAIARRMAAAGTLAPTDGWMVAELEKRLRAAEGSAAAP